ncbi:MAG: SDR family NAD(P)-dependent oxidoreductase, partial [Chitinophagaceae bacterium]
AVFSHNMTEYFKNKVVIVTGGTNGIGKALVDLLLSKGAKVATCGRHHDKLYGLQSEYPSYPLHTVVADVSNENDCRHFIESTIKIFGSIDILINNAGISMRALMKDISMDVLHRGFTTSNIRNVALDKDGKSQGESPMDESSLMSAQECARYILRAIEKKKRTLVLTFTGKRTVFMNKFFPGLADKLVRKFFFKDGKLIK